MLVFYQLETNPASDAMILVDILAKIMLPDGTILLPDPVQVQKSTGDQETPTKPNKSSRGRWKKK